VVTGTVVANLTGLPISGATVTLGSLTTTTSGNGAFSFPTVNAGTYTLSVSATLYTTLTQSVSVAPGQTVTLSIRLRTILGL
jgi:hypothetical protein